MKTLQLFIISIVLFSFAACKEENKVVPEMEVSDPVISTFYFIRHAEKDRSNPENPDPELNQDGLGRAIRWERVFSEIPLTAIYSTNFERTQMTAAPIAVSQDLIVKTYDPSTINIEEFKFANLGAQTLVVGHSNSTPEFVNNILGENKYDTMDDYDNSSLFIVRIIDGVATDLRLKMD